MGNKVHVVPHMHWDREWYFTTEESRILLVNNMEEIMTMLETNENYPYYVLDGQTAVIEDYLAVKPENKERFKKLVEAGKLIIGPWYTQTDEMVVGGESIVRNLLYGMKDCEEFGDPMMIGYLPDSFGQSEKLPQILNGFDIDRCMFWRGSSERHGTNKQNFFWESESEGKVVVQLLPLGYAIGKYLPTDKDQLEKRMSKYIPVLDRGAMTDHILLPNGHDQMPIQKDIFEVMDQLKNIYPERDFFLSKFEHVFDEVEKVDNLDTIQGELLDGKYMRVHRSIFSTRADLKASNTRIENKITNILEPIASIANQLGFSYEEGLIEAIWKDIMKNHAHDSIGCCCSDKVHRAIENRFFDAEDKADELIRYYKRKIVDAMDCNDTLDKFTAFNLLPYNRETVVQGQIITKMRNFKLVDSQGNEVAYEILHSEIIDAGLIDRQIVHYGDYEPFVQYTICLQDTVPAMGYKTYLIQQAEGEAVTSTPSTESNVMENEFFHVEINETGTLTVTDKTDASRYENVLLIEDGSDDGDEYDFSPLADDFLVYSGQTKATVEVKNFANKSFATISLTIAAPKNLDSRKNKVIDGSFDVQYELELAKGSKVIEVRMTIDNRVCDHRVRVLLPNQLATNFSISDNQFGQIKRPVYDTAMDVWEKEGWDERPDSIYPMLSYVGLDNKAGLSVVTNSVREYEVIGENYDTLAITIMRCVGFLGKEEMLRRPGRPSGIKMPTPDSQMLGRYTFEFGIVSNTAPLAKTAKEYVTRIETYNKMPYNAMKLNQPECETPFDYSLFEETEGSFVLSVVKKAQGKDGLIIRGFNADEETKTASFTLDAKKMQEVKLNEKTVLNELSSMQDLSLPKNVAKTYYVEL